MKKFIKKIIPPPFLSCYHFLLALLGAILYGFPSRRLKVIGITGTKGKSTVVELVGKILEEAGYKVASVSSIRFKIADKVWKNELKMTMPGRLKLQRFLRRAVLAGCQYAVIEVTSEGILQHRHRFIDFDVVVFTNLAPEHIERHGSFEKYREAKGKLFQACKNIHVLNLDDKNVNFFSKFPSREKIFYTLQSPSDHISLLLRSSRLISWKIVKGKKLVSKMDGSFSKIAPFKKHFPSRFKVKDKVFNLNLLGWFNIYNALAAISIALSQGINLEICKRALEKIKEIPGRMEIVIEKPFRVIVDYAHTPQSLKEVYETLRNPKFQTPNSKQISNSKFQKSKLICVLGAAGGGRDKWKRPKMGEIASRYCDKIILTNEDPYDEDPMKIIEEIAAGVKGEPEKILDRREAIRRALCLAKQSSTRATVIITGKGSEPWMCLAGGKKIPWDDRKIVKEEFKKLTL